MGTSAAVVLATSLAIAAGGVHVPPDNCFCDGNAHEIHGAACAGHPNLNCGLGKSPPIGCSTDFVACLTTIAKLKYVTNLTLTNGYANGLDLGDAEYTLIGQMLGSEPLSSRLVNVAVLDEREEGCTQSDDGLAGFGFGLQNMKKLRSLTLDNRRSKGLGSLSCRNNTSQHGPFTALSGLGAFGQALGRGLADTLRVIDLNFDDRAGAYAICDKDIAEFSRLGLAKLSLLESVSLGFSYHEVGDDGAEALGSSLANKRKLKGVNLRLKGFQVPSAATKRGVFMTAVGLTKLAGGLGTHHLLQEKIHMQYLLTRINSYISRSDREIKQSRVGTRGRCQRLGRQRCKWLSGNANDHPNIALTAHQHGQARHKYSTRGCLP